MTDRSEEFATEPVPEDRTVGWLRVAVVAAMVAFSLPTFVVGIEVAAAVDGRSAALAIVFGNLLLSAIGATCGAIGSRTRLSSYMLTRVAFGTRGAMLVNLAFALSLLGWFGVNIDLFADAVTRLLDTVLSVEVPRWMVEVGAGVVMTTTTIYGFRAINALSLVLVPVLVVVTVMLLAQALDGRSFTSFLDQPVVASRSFGAAMSAVVGGVIIGAIILPDITRFIRSWQGGIYTAFLCYAVIGSLVQSAGALASIAFGNDDLLEVMILIGLSWAAFAIVIAGSWVLNSLNLYSAGLSIEATLPRMHYRLLIVLLGVLGTVAAFLNILDSFLTFLFYLAIIFAPVAGVIAVDYLALRRRAYHHGRAASETSVLPLALLAWFLGAVVALLGSEAVLTLTGIAALDAILVAAAAHYAFSKWLPGPRTREETS